MRPRWVIALVASLSLLGAAPPAVAQTAPCQFVLGFQALHNLDPADVGDCTDNQASAPNGDSQQHTSKGLMAWRKADNWTAFTNGYTTWINGPSGLVSRLNTQRFAFEHDMGVLAGVWACDLQLIKIGPDGKGELLQMPGPWLSDLSKAQFSPAGIKDYTTFRWFQVSSDPPTEQVSNRDGYPSPYVRSLTYKVQTTKDVGGYLVPADHIVRNFWWNGKQSIQYFNFHLPPVSTNPPSCVNGPSPGD